MTKIQWHDAPDEAQNGSENDSWFAIAMGLLGLIGGYALGLMLL